MAPISEALPWDVGHSKMRGDLAGHVAGLKGSAADTGVGAVTENSNAEGRVGGLPEFSAEEVALHSCVSDCWLIINEEVYDVTSWIPQHPGGAIIHARAGQDCTELFESYHPLYVRSMLGKFKVGRVAALQSASSVLRFSPDTGFYRTLKQRVEAYFKANQINPGSHPLVSLKASAIVLAFLAAYYGAFLAPLELKHAMACALALGLLSALAAASIAHECYHGLNQSWAWVQDYIMGISSFLYRQQHALGHHVNTNINNFDADIRVTEKDPRRVSPHQPQHWYHQYQGAYMVVMYALHPFKSMILDDFRDYMKGTVGRSLFPKMTTMEKIIFWSGKGFYVAYVFALPAIVGNRTVKEFILMKSIALIAQGLAAVVYQVSHLVPKTQFPTLKSNSGTMEVAMSWAEMQVVTTCNFSPGSRYWNHVTGGFNHMIEHHLFPGICHVYLPDIQPIVESTCKEFGLPYNFYPSLGEAVKEHWNHMNNLGAAGIDCHLD